jgi:hypothetical protein
MNIVISKFKCLHIYIKINIKRKYFIDICNKI